MELKLSQEAYKKYLDDQDTVTNERLRPAGVSFLDAMLSEEADFTKTSEGQKIVELIKAL